MPGPTTVKYGGNTTCMEIKANGHRIVVDGGTGMIRLGQQIMANYNGDPTPFHITLLLTHTHHDHTQGLPFFVPNRHPACTVHIYGPQLVTENLAEVLNRAMSPPVFPLGLEELYSERILKHTRHGDVLVFDNPNTAPKQYSLGHEPKEIPNTAVTIQVNHGYHHPRSGVLFFRVTYKERSIVIATDTEGYVSGDQRLIDFVKGTDLLIHDAEYDEHEYANTTVIRQGWGHSTWRMATEVARAAGVKRLALTHHSPAHTDDYLETMLEKAQALFPNTILAQEGMTIDLLTDDEETQ